MNSVEALENIAITFDEGGYEPTTLGAKSGSFKEVFGDEFNIINQDLEHLKTMEELKIIDNNIIKISCDLLCDLLEENKKLLKAIDILKKKNVDLIELCFSYSLNEYNIVVKDTDYNELTQEEYDLLKKVFKNE